MVTEDSKSGDIVKVVTAAILEAAEELSPMAIGSAVADSVEPSAAQCCQKGVCPVRWKPFRPAA